MVGGEVWEGGKFWEGGREDGDLEVGRTSSIVAGRREGDGREGAGKEGAGSEDELEPKGFMRSGKNSRAKR